MGAKSDVVVKLVLVFFISLLSFAVGTFVGKKYSDNQHKLATLEPGVTESADRHVASESHGVDAAEKTEMISDEDIHKLTEENLKKEEFIADDSHKAEKTEETHKDAHGVASSHETPAKESVAEGHGKQEAQHAAANHDEEAVKEMAATNHHEEGHAKPAAAKKTESHDAALAAAQAFLDGKTPEVSEVAKKVSRLPSSLPKDVAQYAVGKFTVQVASYATHADAEKKANKLKDMGYQANVFTAAIKGKTWYRVSFGLYATLSEAQTEKQKYLDKNKTESALVQKIKN